MLAMTADPDPLADLIEAVAVGDRQALRGLFDRAGPRMLGIAMRMIGNREMAEEALQDAFVAVWSNAGRFDREKGSGQAWLATIIRRKAIDRLRASPWLRNESGEPDENISADAHFSASKDNALAVRECMERLDQKERTALELVYYYGLSHRELRVRLDAPLGTVKSWVRRGLIALRQCLDG